MTAQDGHAETSPPAASDGSGDAVPEHSLLLPSADDVREYSADSAGHGRMSRRTLLRVGAVGAGAVAVTAGRALAEPYLAQQGLLSTDGVLAAASGGLSDLIYIEAFPTSPLILSPFTRPAAHPEGARSGAEVGLQQLGQAARTRCRAAELAGQRAAPDLAEPDRLPGPDRLQDRPAGAAARLHHVAGAADRRATASRRSRSTPRARPTRPARSGPCRRARSTASTARSRDRGSTPNTASRCSSASRTTWTRTRWASTGRTSAPRTGRS